MTILYNWWQWFAVFMLVGLNISQVKSNSRYLQWRATDKCNKFIVSLGRKVSYCKRVDTVSPSRGRGYKHHSLQQAWRPYNTRLFPIHFCENSAFWEHCIDRMHHKKMQWIFKNNICIQQRFCVRNIRPDIIINLSQSADGHRSAIAYL